MTEKKGDDLICNGELEIIRITEDLYDEAIKFHKEHFMKHENLNRACELMTSEDYFAEVRERQRNYLREGISFAVRHCESGELVAISVNSIMRPFNRSTIKTPRLKAIVEVMARIKRSFNIFEEWNIDCAFEINCLATHHDYVGFGLATLLVKHDINFAREMLQGTLTERDSLPEHVRELKPKAVTSVLTSLFTQKIFAKIGIETVYRIPYSELYFEDKSVAEKIDPMHECLILVAKRL